MKSKKRIALLFELLILCALASLPAHVHAGDGYFAFDKSTRLGMLVSLTNNPGVVEPTSDKNASSLLGVVGNSETDFNVQPGQIPIQTSGTVKTLASTLGGDIKVGDRISPSYVVGIGMRNNEGGWVVGVAQQSLDRNTPGAVKTSIKDESGGEHEVFIATIDVVINVVNFNPSNNPNTKTEAASPVPKRLQVFADSIAGKRASVMAMAMASGLLLAGVFISGFIVNSTIKNGIQSLGRQPLAKKSILQGVSQTLALALVVLLFSIGGALVIIRFL